MNYWALAGFFFLVWTVFSGVAGAWIARAFANRDLGDETQAPPKGEAWTRATTRSQDFGRATLPDIDGSFSEVRMADSWSRARELLTRDGVDVDALLERAGAVMTAAEREQQRRSFAYGNCNIDNSNVTRELVDRVADKMASVPPPVPEVARRKVGS